MICQQIIQRDNFSKKAMAENSNKKYNIPNLSFDLKISPQEATSFYHNTNILKFIRKNILFNNQYIFKQYEDEYIEEVSQIPESDPAFIDLQVYNPKVQDRLNGMTEERS